MPFSKVEIGNFLKAIAISLALIATLYGSVSWLGVFALRGMHILGISLVIYLIGIVLTRSILPTLNAEGNVAGIIIFSLCDAAQRQTSFYQSSHWLLEVTLASACLSLIIPLIKDRQPNAAMLPIWTIFCCCLAICGFFYESAGRLIFSDDHPAFLYRLHQLKTNFPNIPFFNPAWNAGVEAREFFPSGTLGIFFLWLPLIMLSDLLSSYNFIVIGTLFVFIPWLIYASSKLLGYDKSSSCLAAILTLTIGPMFYRWGLSYGTLPFLLSASCLPLYLALVNRFIRSEQDFQPGHALLFVFAASLSIFWTPCLLLVAPLTLIAAFKFDQYRRKPLFILSIIALTIIHLPWLLLFIEASKVLNFIGLSLPNVLDASLPSVHSAPFINNAVHQNGALIGSYLTAREMLRSTNPLILFLVPAAIVTLCRLRNRFYLTALLIALSIAIFGPAFKPRLELQRFWLVLLLLIIPVVASLTIDHLRHFFQQKKKHRVLGIAVFMTIPLLSPLWIWRITTNLTYEKYSFAGPELYQLAKAIQEHSGTGRALFMGFILHELCGGHIAPLPLLTTTPLIASSYQHDKWQYTDVIPSQFLADRENDGISKYLDLMNVSLVIAHESYWKRWLRTASNEFIEVAKVGKFALFKREKYQANYFQDGSGIIIEQNDNMLKIRVDQNRTIVKFKYSPLLTCAECRLSSVNIGDQLSLLSIETSQAPTTVYISMLSPYKRIKRMFSGNS